MSRDLDKDPQSGHLVGVENTPFPAYEHKEYPKIVKGADGLDYVVDDAAGEKAMRNAEQKAAHDAADQRAAHSKKSKSDE